MADFRQIRQGVLYNDAANMFALIFRSDKYVNLLKESIPYLVHSRVGDLRLVMLPCKEDTILLLRNHGLPVDGMEPFRIRYRAPLAEGLYPPMAHQLTTAAFCSVNKRAYVTSTMRTGKTYSMVACMDYLQTSGQVQGAALIVATVSNLTGVWYHTLTTTLPHRHTVVVHGGTGKADRITKLNQPADYYVINYDGVKMVKDELIDMVNNNRIGMVVVDELTHYGNTTSARFKALDAVVNGKKPVPYVWGLTGSPGDNPIPVFGFCKLINRDRMLCQKMVSWRDLTQFKYGREAWQWRNRSNCADIIYATMQPNIRFDKKDIMDLPPVVYQLRDCEMSGEQEVAYRQVKDDMVALLESGEVIEAVHKASVMGKLFQIAQGTAIVSGGQTVDLDNQSRLRTIVECIEEASQKTVIFCAYTGVIDRLARQLRDKGYSVETVDGRVTGNKRTRIFHDFQNAKDPQVLICHPQTTAFGVELAAADTMIFNGPPLSGGFIYEQALERLSSLKQKAKQIAIIQIAATREEREFFKGLDGGVKASELVNEMFANLTKNSQGRKKG